MSESATEMAGPSLEDILWRAMDRFAEEPAMLDAEEFAARIAGAFAGELPEEAFVERFIQGNPELARKADMAEAIVRSTHARLHVYHFDLDHLEYVVIEEEDQVVVVSDFGQFALANDSHAQQAIAAAVVRDRGSLQRRAADRSSSEPRAYLVRQDGDLLALDVRKLAAAIARLPVRQVSAPAVESPPIRMLPFEPRARRMTPRSEARALRENDRRVSMPVPPPGGGLDEPPTADARPSTAAPAVFVLLPDGSLARPEMGSAARWNRMVSDWTLRAGLLASSGGSVAVSGSQRFTLDAGKVTAVFTGGEPRLAAGAVGGRAAARSDGVVAARADFAPVRVLGDDELAQAVVAGAARIVAGWTAPVAAAAGASDRYWMQPETVFSPTQDDRAFIARADPTAGLDAPVEPQMVASGQPLQLGQITGDPWADWALQVAGAGEAAPLAARALRRRAASEIRLRGEPVVAFRAPDGTLLLNGERGPVRLAAIDRSREGGPDGAALGGAAPPGAMDARRGRASRLAPRSGALPAPAVATLRLALERTAGAAGYKLPAVGLAAAPDAGRSLRIATADPRGRSTARAGRAPVSGGPGDKIARLVLSMPFPNPGEVHVGSDLSDALSSYLAAPVTPPLLRRAVLAPGEFRLGPGAPIPAAVRQPPPEEAPELVLAPAAELPDARPLGPGEDEIFIPMPLWAQMGRGQASFTHHVMASPLAHTSYAPPLGTYTLVRPAGFPLLDPDVARSPEGPEMVELAGPTAIRLRPRPQGGARADSAGGKLLLGKVPLDAAAAVAARRAALEQLPAVPPARPPAAAVARFNPGLPASDPRAHAAPRRAVPTAGALVAPALGAPAAIEGLPPGTWSGARPGAADGYVPWSYSAEAWRSATAAVGGISLAPVARPGVAAIATGMRFRYAAAPLWWSSAVREGDGRRRTPASRRLDSIHRPASSAAAIWRSIFARDASAPDLSGGMDRGHDQPVRGLSSVEQRMDVLVALGLVGGGNAAAPAGARARGPETIYVAMDEQGRAGPATGDQVRRGNALAKSVEMRIVAAIPPSPPPLHSMGSGSAPARPQVLARHRHAPGGEHNGDDAVNQSRIEGSVEAIAQRIYHRIRRRIASDRERFGG